MIREITFIFSSLECMHRLYIAFVRKLEYTSVVWNSVTSTDASKPEHIQQRFAAHRINRFHSQVNYSYAYALEKLKFHTICKRRYHLEALFLAQIQLRSKFRLFVLETLGSVLVYQRTFYGKCLLLR
jgi:hypothetical protein